MIYVSCLISINSTAGVTTLPHGPAHWRNHGGCATKNYIELLRQLCAANITILLFVSASYIPQVEIVTATCTATCIIIPYEYSQLPLAIAVAAELAQKDSVIKLPAIRNISKDTTEYLVLMNSKFFFMQSAVEYMQQHFHHTTDKPQSKFAWIDIGIFHIIPFNMKTVISNALISADDYISGGGYGGAQSPPVLFPGCWDKSTALEPDFINKINWRFCGGFFIIQRDNINHYSDVIYQYIAELLRTQKQLTWEVNIWAAIEYVGLLDFGWYKADHNEQIILNIVTAM
jgi:hypothetical protein